VGISEVRNSIGIHFPKNTKKQYKIEGTVDFVPVNAYDSNLSDASHDLIVFF